MSVSRLAFGNELDGVLAMKALRDRLNLDHPARMGGLSALKVPGKPLFRMSFDISLAALDLIKVIERIDPCSDCTGNHGSDDI